MPQSIEEVLAEVEKGEESPAYLVVGEEFLVRKAAEELVKKLVPDAAAGLNLSVQDGASPREVAMDLVTLPLLPGRKVVLVHDPEFLAPKKARGDGLAKAREAWRAGRRKEAARRLLAVAARAGWGVDQLDPSGAGSPGPDAWKSELNIELADADVAFLREAAAFCRDERITAPETDVGALVDVLEKRRSEGQVLVIAATEVDPKNPLSKWVAENGCVVERNVAAKLKELDVSEVAAEVLAPFKKRLSRQAEALLKDRVGGNMRLLQSELEKLALYAEGAVIEPADVELLVARAREEEFLELSDALQKRDLRAALRYADDALDQETHPLALLGTISSIVRTLLANRERLAELAHGEAPRSFDEFKSRIFPKIEQEAKASKSRVPHPYAAFLSMQAAARYRREQLLRGLVACAEADLALKGGGMSGRLVIERLLWGLCA
jgi:DNA polymerase-3 subunit delta